MASKGFGMPSPIRAGEDIQGRVCREALFQVFPGYGPHGGVVGAVLKRWNEHGHPSFAAERFQGGAESGVGRHPAADGDGATASAGQGQIYLGNDGIDRSLLK